MLTQILEIPLVGEFAVTHKYCLAYTQSFSCLKGEEAAMGRVLRSGSKQTEVPSMEPSFG